MVKSLIDVDLYKLTMMQFFFKYYNNTVVKFKFNNRTDINLGYYIDKDRLINELNSVKKLNFKPGEVEYLRGLGYFEDDFLDYLKNYKLPNITVDNVNGRFDIHTTANWHDVTLWETIVLSTINELYYYSKYSKNETEAAEKKGLDTLRGKLDLLKSDNITSVITDFGTRRRFSHKWQDIVIKEIKNHPAFVGTSNVYFAKKYNMKPVGTNAHELYMVAAGINADTDDNLKSSHSKIMNQWYEMYGEDLSIGLTDTFGSNFFFEDFKDKADKWKGLRHDSGSPEHFGNRVVTYYNHLNIDSSNKLLVFSDGLDVDKIIDLHDMFIQHINLSFGWGTKLTNDLGFETLSIVMKAVEVVSHNNVTLNNMLVKLSDNLNKNLGTPEDLKRYKRVFGYVNNQRERLEV